MNNECVEYSFEQKEKLARNIQKLKKESQYKAIQDIILKHNPEINITTNPSGHFMYFQNLKVGTYYAIEKYIKKITITKSMKRFTSDNDALETSEPYETIDSQSYSSFAVSERDRSDRPDRLDKCERLEGVKVNIPENNEQFTNNPKLKYSNREKNLIKRKNYDEEIKNQELLYSHKHSSDSNTNTNTENNSVLNLDLTQSVQPSQDLQTKSEKIFVKRKQNNKIKDRDHDVNMTLS